MRALAAVFLLVLAGCTTPAPDAPEETLVIADLAAYWEPRLIHGVDEVVPFSVDVEGATLRGHVYLPDAPRPLSTILEYSPYFDGQDDPSDGRLDGTTMTGNHRPLLEAGFAVALVNLRGTGTSDGCVYWGTEVDRADVAAVIEELAAQPWSDGNVGMVGTSYPGWTQYMALAAKPPALKAVIPVSGVIDLHALLTRNGAALSVGPVVTTQWHALYSAGEATYPDQRGGTIRHAECGPRIAEDALESNRLYTSGDRNPYWDERDLRAAITESDVPILFTNGLTDGEGHILQFEGLWDLIRHGDKRMMVGQWGHGGTAHPSGDWPLMRVSWFDHYLRGGPALVQPGVVDYQDDLGVWHVTDQWPPASQPVDLYLSDRSLVADSDAVQNGEQIFQSTPTNPCPGTCMDSLVDLPEIPACGPFQALYVSPPLVEDAFVAGNFHVNLTLSSTLPDGNLAVFLYRTSGAGACPDMDMKEIRRALTDLRHAQSLGHPGADFPIDTPTEVNLVSHPFASQLKAGERLVLAVGGGALELTPEHRLPVLTVHAGGRITLPVVEGQLAFQE